MNCLDFRRRWLTMPGERDVALTRHERVCASCRQFARRESLLERKLVNALAIDVPASLNERIHRRRDFSERARQRQVRPLRYALIASGLLILGLALLLVYEYFVPRPSGIEIQTSVARQHAEYITSAGPPAGLRIAARGSPPARC